jgi:hypothetical protein
MWEPYFVSVIDCRGEKAYRENYAKWHEIGHLLILTDDGRAAFRRTHCSEAELRDPEESLVELIAGTFAFWPEMIRAHVTGDASFELIEVIRQKVCPEASRQSAFIGIVKAWPTPCMLVRAELGPRKNERRQIEQGSFDFQEAPVAVLRAVNVSQSDEARKQKFQIFPNMRVPDESVIHRVFEAGAGAEGAVEDLSWWESSDGTRLPPKKVMVSARYSWNGVDALIAPRRA